MNLMMLLAVLSLCFVASGAIFATLVGFMMIGEVNRKRDGDNQIPYFSFSPLQTLKRLGLPREYSRLYPNGHLHIYFFIALAVMLIAVFGLGFFINHMGTAAPAIPHVR